MRQDFRIRRDVLKKVLYYNLEYNPCFFRLILLSSWEIGRKLFIVVNFKRKYVQR